MKKTHYLINYIKNKIQNNFKILKMVFHLKVHSNKEIYLNQVQYLNDKNIIIIKIIYNNKI